MKDTFQTTAPIDYNYERARLRLLLKQYRERLVFIWAALILAFGSIVCCAYGSAGKHPNLLALGLELMLMSVCLICAYFWVLRRIGPEIRAEIKGIKSYVTLEDKGI